IAINRDGDLFARVASIGEDKLGLQFVALGSRLAARLERNQVSAWDASTTSSGRLLVEEGILLGLAADGYPPVSPCCDVVIDQCRGIVVIAHITVHDPWVGLPGQRSDYVAKRHVGQPCSTVVGGLAPPHPITRNGRVTLLAAGALACIIPHRKQG